MNRLEKYLSNRTWCYIYKAFTAVHNGFGFVIYRENNQMWLAGLSKEVTHEQLKTHNTEPPKIVGFWVNTRGIYTDRMFVIPASSEFVANVLASTFPELRL